MRSRFTAGFLASLMAAGVLAISAPGANASSQGRRNTAIGLGAAAAYELLKGKTSTGLIAAAGAAYAYKRYSDARKNEPRRARYSVRQRYDGRPYASNGSLPHGYLNNRGYSVADDGTAYGRRHTGPYTTDAWGNRHYYDPSAGDGYHQYAAAHYRTAAYRQSQSSARVSLPRAASTRGRAHRAHR